MQLVRTLFFLLTVCVTSLFSQEFPKILRSPISASARFDIGACLGQDFAAFYAVGWSEKGRFAWIMREEGTTANSYKFSYFVQDLISGEMLWKKSNVLSLAEMQDNIEDSTTASFQKQLIAYGIVKTSDEVRVKKFPLPFGSDTLNVQLDKLNGMYQNKEILREISIDLTSKIKGAKRVFFRQNDPNSPAVQDIALCASLRSPYEERLALILCKRYLGFNDVCVVRFQVIGVHMSDGWK